MTSPAEDNGAAVIARFLAHHGVARVYGLCGGHIMPIWMALDAAGIRIVDVRDERAAVYMAQAEAEVTGRLGIALVTAGPGLTNAITGITNAHVSRAPILVLSGTPPRPQENRGALQDLDHVQLVRSVTRYARTVREPALVPQELAEAAARALGEGGDPGPSYLDFPTDTLRAPVPSAVALPELMRPRPASRAVPDPDSVARAVELLFSAQRPLVVSGRGARGTGPQLVALLDRLGCPYLDTGESRGLVPAETLAAILAAAEGRAPQIDPAWAAAMREGHRARAATLQGALRAAPDGADGRMHPNRLVAAIQDAVAAMPGARPILVTDGGDFLSFARVGLSAETMLDPGPFGCIGIGVPYGIAAALAAPDRTVVVATGDGAFGFNAIEIDTAVRHAAPVLIVVANNGAWQIEVHDQTVTHGRVVGTRLQDADHAAMARAFGMHAERVERAEDLPAALARALAHRPALLDVLVTTDAVSSDARTGLAWVPDLQPLETWDKAERAWRER